MGLAEDMRKRAEELLGGNSNGAVDKITSLELCAVYKEVLTKLKTKDFRIARLGRVGRSINALKILIACAEDREHRAKVEIEILYDNMDYDIISNRAKLDYEISNIVKTSNLDDKQAHVFKFKGVTFKVVISNKSVEENDELCQYVTCFVVTLICDVFKGNEVRSDLKEMAMNLEIKLDETHAKVKKAIDERNAARGRKSENKDNVKHSIMEGMDDSDLDLRKLAKEINNVGGEDANVRFKGKRRRPYNINADTLAGVFREVNDYMDNNYLTLMLNKIDKAMKLQFRSENMPGRHVTLGDVVIEVVTKDSSYEFVNSRNQLHDLIIDIYKIACKYKVVHKFLNIGNVSFRLTCETRLISTNEEFEYVANKITSVLFYMFNDDMSLKGNLADLEKSTKERDELVHKANPHIYKDGTLSEESKERKLSIIKRHYEISNDYDSIKKIN